MKKRFFAVLLCLCLLVGLVPGMGTTAFTAGHIIQVIGTTHFKGNIPVVFHDRNVAFTVTMVFVQLYQSAVVNCVLFHQAASFLGGWQE